MKKPSKERKSVVLKSDKSFDELIEDAFNDKTLPKKRKGLKKDKITFVLTTLVSKVKKKTAKKAVKKSKKK